MVWPEKSKKTERKPQRKTNFFCRIFSPNFPANFPCVFFRSENGKRRRKTVSQNFNIKIQHGMMIQSRMPTKGVLQTEPMCLWKQQAGFRKKDFYFNSQLCTALPTKKIEPKMVHTPCDGTFQGCTKSQNSTIFRVSGVIFFRALVHRGGPDLKRKAPCEIAHHDAHQFDIRRPSFTERAHKWRAAAAGLAAAGSRRF